MNKNRTEGGQSKENPGEKPSALSREIDVLAVSTQSKTKDKNIYGTVTDPSPDKHLFPSGERSHPECPSYSLPLNAPLSGTMHKETIHQIS